MAIRHDHHIHTVYSGHSSPDMVVGAVAARVGSAGLKRAVILEHVPEVGRDQRAVSRGCFDGVRRPQIDAIAAEVPLWRDRCAARLLGGVEVDADPLTCDGSLLLTDLSGVDVVLGSTHFLPGGGGMWYEMGDSLPRERLQQIYEQWMAWSMNVAANPLVDVLSHPGAEMAAMGAIERFEGQVLEDFSKLMQVCAKYNTAFELNELIVRKMSAEQCESYVDVVALAPAHNVKLSIGSDAHHLDRIGDYPWVQTVVDRLGLGPGDYFHPERKA